MNIYQKLVEVRKTVPYLKKEGQSGKGDFGYNYTSSSQVLGAVRQKMDELYLFLSPNIISEKITAREKSKPDGKVTITYEAELKMEFVWINAEEPSETIRIPWFAAGVDIGDSAKAIGKALTYAEKYFMLKQFNIATDKDDPDYFQGKAESSVKETPNQDHLKSLEELATEFGTLRNQPLEAVYKVLNIKDVNKLSVAQINRHLVSLKTWITPLKKMQSQNQVGA